MNELVLASRSPRRLRLLVEAGFEPIPEPADLDDADLVPPPVDPLHWVTALSYLKARRVADRRPGAVTLGADTVVIKDGRVIGQPRDAEHARSMIRDLREGSHRVATGVTLLGGRAPRRLLADVATVRVGAISDEAVDSYVESGEWRGKAGAYNLADRQSAGWPLACEGDPATVMGLPMRRLGPILADLLPGGGITDTRGVSKGAS